MWQALKLAYQAFCNFWTPTEELRAVTALPFRERVKQLGERSYWRANFRWPVIWRRLVVMFVAMQMWNVGYLAVRGFQTVALERQERASAANALERAAQQVWTAKVGSAQDLQGRQNMKKALDRLAASAHMPLGQFLAELTHVEVNSFDQFDDDAGFGAFCDQLRLNLCEHADAATHRARLNVGTLYCQISVPCWDDLSPTPPPVQAETPEFPYRTTGPYRTAFVEAATKTCIRDGQNDGVPKDGVPKDVLLRLCDCQAGVVATFMTAKDRQEIAQGGIHVTPRYRELAETAQTACEKAFTGQ